MWKDGEMTTSRSATLTTACIFPLIFFVFLVEVVTTTSDRENMFKDYITDRFSTASRSELLEIWHTDCHRRCFLQLQTHINLACRFDPYKISRIRRSAPKDRQIGTLAELIQPASNSTIPSSRNDTRGLSPFIARHMAKSFLMNDQALSNPAGKVLSRRKRDGNIMNECCFQKACAWEEFGEYCHGHLRRPYERLSHCINNS